MLSTNIVFQHACNNNMLIFNISGLKPSLSVRTLAVHVLFVQIYKHYISNIYISVHNSFSIDNAREKMSALNVSAINSITQNTFLSALALNIGIGCQW